MYGRGRRDDEPLHALRRQPWSRRSDVDTVAVCANAGRHAGQRKAAARARFQPGSLEWRCQMIGVTEAAQTSEIPDVTNEGEIVKAHYDAGRKSFWTTNSRGGWIEVSETSLRRILRDHGF